ncbi:hypothetical protein [Adhaeribacter soli]|uniref:DUF4625 domain-containing protein n=1 Tax=Adhaeribacter soli TaxID=2607655 RepID=A0A5N1J710_9BACT|nr:hypothetical protein [Adhaeribacter soli]KAA9345903.1 hypothetical protein F0P94_02135 [Adhaeribacter soli]
MTVAFAVLTMVGCKNIFEDNDLKVDGSTPYQVGLAPAANSTYQASEPFKISSEVTDKDNVAEVEVNLVRLASDAKGSENVVNFKRFPDNKAFKLDTTLAPNSLAPGQYQLIIRAKDKRTNEGTKEVMFSVQ